MRRWTIAHKSMKVTKGILQQISVPPAPDFNETPQPSPTNLIRDEE